jgi:hypothetical protein
VSQMASGGRNRETFRQRPPIWSTTSQRQPDASVDSSSRVPTGTTRPWMATASARSAQPGVR